MVARGIPFASVLIFLGFWAGGVNGFDPPMPGEPTDAAGFYDRGSQWYAKGDYDKAIKDFSEAIRLAPKSRLYPRALMNRARAWRAKNEFDKAIQDYDELIRLNPKVKELYSGRADLWLKKKQHDKAIDDFTAALRLDPKDVWMLEARGRVWMEKKEYDRAIQDFTAFIHIGSKDDSEFTQAFGFVLRADVWSAKGDYDKAIQDYDEAIRIAPTLGVALGEKAWLLSTCPVEKYRDGKKARELATKVCEKGQWKYGYPLEDLAAACAECGQFDEAVKWQKKALEDTRFAERSGEKARQGLKLYEEKKPYRGDR